MTNAYSTRFMLNRAAAKKASASRAAGTDPGERLMQVLSQRISIQEAEVPGILSIDEAPAKELVASLEKQGRVVRGASGQAGRARIKLGKGPLDKG